MAKKETDPILCEEMDVGLEYELFSDRVHSPARLPIVRLESGG